MEEVLKPIISKGFYTTITHDATDEILKEPSDSKILLITGSSIGPNKRHGIENGAQLISWAKKNHPGVTAAIISCLEVAPSEDYSVIRVKDPTEINTPALQKLATDFIKK